MRPGVCRAFLLLATPACLAAQATRFTPRPVRLGVDTFDLQVRNPDGAGAPYTFVLVEALSRGAGANATIRLVAQLGGRSLDGARTLDTTEVDAASLQFRRSVTRFLGEDGRELSVTTAGRMGTMLVRRMPDDTGTVTTSERFDAGAPPLGVPNLVMRAAPLAPAWTASLRMAIPSGKSIITVRVDSVRAGVSDGRRVWLVHAQPGDRSRVTYSIDSLTRDLVRLETRDSAGAVVSTMLNRRYRPRPTRTATSAPPSREEVARVAGRYVAQQMELASELDLRPDGHFTFGIAYGALDLTGSGRWRIEDSTLVLQSDGASRSPRVTLASASGVATDSLQVLLVDTAGRPLSNLTIDARWGRSTPRRVQSRASGTWIPFERGAPPTELGIGVDMLAFRVPFTLSSPPKKVYRMVFDPGDLTTQRFDDARARLDGSTLHLEIDGRALRYQRR